MEQNAAGDAAAILPVYAAHQGMPAVFALQFKRALRRSAARAGRADHGAYQSVIRRAGAVEPIHTNALAAQIYANQIRFGRICGDRRGAGAR